MSDASARENVGAALIARGWRQGSLLPAVGHAWFERDGGGEWTVQAVPPRPDDGLIVVSQECDIAAAGEPFVEVMPYAWQPKGAPVYTAARLGNSGRSFLIRRVQDASGHDGGDIVDATRRVQIAKASLLFVTPTPLSVLDDRDRLRRFRAWLGGRYSRPALDQRIVDAVQKPILKGIAKLQRGGEFAEALDLIREIRFVPLPDEPPFALELVVLVENESQRTDERIAGFLGLVERWLLASSVDCHLARRQIVSATSLSIAAYENTLRLPLDYLTLGGETVQGALPIEGIDHG